MPVLVDSEPKPASHGGVTEMTTIRFEQDHGVGTIVLANPPSNRIGSQFAVMMLDVAIDLFRTEDTTKGILNSAKAIQAGVQPSPLTFLGR
jgi:hypothetical protein